MNAGRLLGIILVVVGQTIAAQKEGGDTVWLCRDTTPEQYWLHMQLADTFPDNRGTFSMVDTGDSYDGTPYVNFDYEFGNPDPGYAGFKFYWDNGIMQFYVEEFDSMVLWHKGPLPGHKVKMIWAQGSAGCGTPINYQDYYEYKSSTEWKRESFGFPPDFIKNGLFELRMLIYNDTETSETSPPGCLKIDNMFFLKNGVGTIKKKQGPTAVSGPECFTPALSGKVTLSIYSLQGEQLFRECIGVTAGERYTVSRFARKHSNLPARWIQCVRITGSGVNLTRKVVH